VLILPVLDLMAGRVVRGIAGRRGDYRQITSALTRSNDPAAVAAAFADSFGLSELYVADLDAIEGGTVAGDVYRQLRSNGFRLWVDAGVRTIADVIDLQRVGVEQLVVGLETVAGPNVLAEAAELFGERIVFSLDLREGQPLGNRAAWPMSDATRIVDHVVEAGVRRVIVLDLARVGIGSGIGTESLCRQILQTHPRLEVFAGGGVRGIDDLRHLRDSGARGALVASALHDGRLSSEEIAELREA
jgi:phosphoribosylformimino-5-aminoimidazole carboxamide ribotide isomerase